jgi:putative peptide zinc metalloprotease protein
LSAAGRPAWCVKDPLADKFLQLRDEELFILRALDGRASLDGVVAAFERRFAPQRLGLGQLQSFLGMLHQEGLVLADGPGQGEELLRRAEVGRRRARLGTWSNPLAIRFRGLDPERFLRWLYPKVRWFFSPWFVAAGVALAVAALGLCLVRIDEVLGRMPSASEFLHPGNVFWLAVALVAAKGLHELGHALTTKHFGGQCHELGIMLLVGTPCLYCDVSDAWLVPDKWRRAAIGAAGMYVELLLASVATFAWWWSEPGLFNSLCLNLMFVCSVGTVLFNANPLLRFDGYFILSDLADMPNLGQQAAAVVRTAVARWLLGMELPAARLLPPRGRWLLATWWVASVVYRTVLLVLILWLVIEVAKPYGWAPAARVFAMLIVAMWALPWGWRLVGLTRRPDWRRHVQFPRLVIRGGLVMALVAGVAIIPWPYSLKAPVMLAPIDARSVYVTAPGRLLPEAASPAEEKAAASWRAGQFIASGQVLARLVNPDLDLEVARLTGERNRLQKRLEALESRRSHDVAAGSQIPTAREALLDAEERLAERRRDIDRLTLRAPVDGTVLPPPSRPQATPEGSLAGWSGTPLDERNQGCFMATGDVFCLVGDPHRLEAVLVVDQSAIEFVRLGQQVEILVDQAPGQILTGRVDRIAQLDLELAPRELPAHAEIAMRTDATGERRLVEGAYQVRVALDAGDQPLLVNATGEAKVHAQPRSLANRLARFVQATFRFRL